jgi:NitT/TauT family transport system substrate-binding protein
MLMHPMTIVRPGTSAAETPEGDLSTVQVAEDSPITTLEAITIRAALEKAGVNPASVTFVEPPFPDMLPALGSGSVDAAWAIEPFSTVGLQQKNRAIMARYAEYAPGMQIGLVLSPQPYAKQNPEEFKDFLVRAGGFDPAVVADMNLPHYTSTLDVTFLEQVGQDMVDDGPLEEVPDYGDFIDENA